MLANADPKAAAFNGAQGVVVRWATPDELFARALSDAETLAEDPSWHAWGKVATDLRGGNAKAAQDRLRRLLGASMSQGSDRGTGHARPLHGGKDPRQASRQLRGGVARGSAG